MAAVFAESLQRQACAPAAWWFASGQPGLLSCGCRVVACFRATVFTVMRVSSPPCRSFGVCATAPYPPTHPPPLLRVALLLICCLSRRTVDIRPEIELSPLAVEDYAGKMPPPLHQLML